ncbi:hypothetical protein F5Y05DRAFT_410666 [Hypoxylon sp. FL0543]|nr:hypothetical protein F5Y05DRAFT_410666 [Hypoxylon sp. FL0543]
MAPTPDNPDDHYDAAVPLDGGFSPADLGGSSKHFSTTGLEVGIITGVVVLVILGVVGLFIWRSRRNNNAKNSNAASTGANGATKERADRGSGTSVVDEATSRRQDEHMDAAKNNGTVPRRGGPFHFANVMPQVHVREQAVEEHEIANRA